MTAAGRGLSARAAAELLALLIAAGSANQAAARYLTGCLCGHVEASHDQRANGSRGRCTVAAGTAGNRCDCPAFAPIAGRGTEL